MTGRMTVCSQQLFLLDMFIAASESAVLFKELIGRMSKCEILHFLKSVVKMCSQLFGCERAWLCLLGPRDVCQASH